MYAIPQSARPTRGRFGRTLVRSTAVLAAVVLGSSLVSGVASASGKTSDGGDFTVLVNGTSYNPAAGKSVKLKDIAVSGTIAVRGVNVGFDIDTATLGAYNYTLTGASDTQRMVTAPTVVFASKVPTLTAAQRANTRIKELEIKDDTLVVTFSTAAGKLKIQAKDGAQGGIFQMEPEFAGPVELVHTLGAGLFYFVNSFTGKINFGNGIDAVTASQSPVNFHQMLLGKDSPQVATKTYQDGTVTKWLVTSADVWAESSVRTPSSSRPAPPTAPATARRKTASAVRSRSRRTRSTPPRSAADVPDVRRGAGDQVSSAPRRRSRRPA